jgi:hypothetical protein
MAASDDTKARAMDRRVKIAGSEQAASGRMRDLD